MRLSNCLTLATLLTTALATPFLACSLTLRTQLCNDPPTPKPEPPLTPRTIPSEQPRTWQIPNTQTSLQITLIRKIPGLIVISLLEDIMTYVTEHIDLYHDSQIAGGVFDWNGPHNLAFQIINANNHQTTWGVLGAAVQGLRDFMLSGLDEPNRLLEWNTNGYAVYFSVVDGGNVVGMGTLG